jgi:ABC-type branched-subunit amino acid transport system permease subunit
MGIEYLFMTVVGGVGYMSGAPLSALDSSNCMDDYLQVAAAQT